MLLKTLLKLSYAWGILSYIVIGGLRDFAMESRPFPDLRLILGSLYLRGGTPEVENGSAFLMVDRYLQSYFGTVVHVIFG